MDRIGSMLVWLRSKNFLPDLFTPLRLLYLESQRQEASHPRSLWMYPADPEYPCF